MAEFFHIWIRNYGLIARPLYEKLKETDDDPLEWNSECEGAFQEVKKQLLQAPALALPDSAIQTRGTYPREGLQIDFTVMRRVPSNFRYLLVLVDKFSGWIEALNSRKLDCFQLPCSTCS